MTSAADWWLGARPRTLPAALVPVLVGTSTAVSESAGLASSRVVARATLSLVVSLSLQVGVNYANDYSDGKRGTDDQREGPIRLVASGRASPGAVRNAAFCALGVACVAGLALAAVTTWWLVAVGIACVASAWMYTGGPRPYGYAGYGELFVFVFFGLVATIGTSYVIAESFGTLSFLSGVMTGLLAVALLVVNNIRDIEGDGRSGKRTLAVRLGSERSKWLYVSLFGLAAATIVAASLQDAGAALGLVGLLSALPAISTVRHATTASELIRALGMTARVQIVVGVLYSAGVLLT